MARISYALARVAILGLAAGFSSVAVAQNSGQTWFSQSDLDQIMAPVALYPDDLLSNIFTAATYPLEVVQADRYVKQNGNLQGDALADALNTQSWDPSVKALAQFPSVLAMMDDELSWTEELGDAFLAQPADVMDTVQSLRAKAAANGSLQSNPEETVQTQGNDISIEPAAPDTVYVPYYDPTVVYGVWWWPAQLPLFWNPPAIYRPYNFGNIGAGGIAYGGRVIVAPGFSHFRPNWGAHTVAVGGPHHAAAAMWQHDPAHRLGVAYRTVPSINRAVQQATPSPSVAPVQYSRPVQAETYRPASVQMQQRYEVPQQMPQQAPVAAAPAEVRSASGQHAEGNHGEPNHGDANRNGDPHKPN